ncbi:MAG: LysM peptidoglycan-binding domain-containing protein, partial [Saprospiraceae bacterium]|nr:LysM peptidoglycan-binding domain-containing protein [Saprospiraceae bacterium]
MKKLILFSLSLLTLSNLPAQSPIYVLFNASCMDQLEYRNAKSGTPTFAYSIRPNTDEQYLFMSGESGMPTQSLPAGTFDCRNLKLSEDLVRNINLQAATRQMYILIQRAEDYLMMPIYNATQIKRVGSYYLLVSSKYVFAVDTSHLSYQDNLQGEGSPSVIRFTGSKLANCRYQYSFHGEPSRNYTESLDFDFIYGIGITTMRVGKNATEMTDNELRLIGVNGEYFEKHLAAICQNSPVTNVTSASASKWISTSDTYNDKENASITNNNNTWNQPSNNTGANYNPNYNTPLPQLANCPESPGRGYHIVQRGESLKAIARTYSVDLKSIIRWNNIKNPDHIEICQKIWLQSPPAYSGSTTTSSKGDDTAPKTAPGLTVFNQSVYWDQGANTSPNSYNYTAPAQYNTNTNVSTTTPNVYYVQQGETLYGISKRFGCAEECFRRANNMPLEGNVVIRTGQALVIPECTCQTSGQATPNTNMNRSMNNPVPPEVSSVLNSQTQPPAPVIYSTPKTVAPPTTNQFNETSVAGNAQ